MKKAIAIIVVVLLVVVQLQAVIFNSGSEKEVEKVVHESYFNGAFNRLNTEAMRKGFHPDFAIFSAKGNEISKYPIDTWIKGIEKNKLSADFDPSRSKMDCKIISTDVTEGCAAVKVEISKDGKKIFTDYLSLLKFDEGWKIVAKVYHRHK
jgi:hypothetical protein